MHVHDALLSRRTIHRYQPGELPEEVVQRALLAAHHAPCHKLTWPWRFVRVGPLTRAGLADVAVAVKEKKGPLDPAARDSVREAVLSPPALIVVCQQVHDDPARAAEDYAAIACAIQNLQLSLHADGFGSKWSTGGVTSDPRTSTLLGLGAGERVVGFLWAGRAAQTPEIRRPDLTGFVRSLP